MKDVSKEFQKRLLVGYIGVMAGLLLLAVGIVMFPILMLIGGEIAFVSFLYMNHISMKFENAYVLLITIISIPTLIGTTYVYSLASAILGGIGLAVIVALGYRAIRKSDRRFDGWDLEE